jgi:hypothetical protein
MVLKLSSIHFNFNFFQLLDSIPLNSFNNDQKVQVSTRFLIFLILFHHFQTLNNGLDHLAQSRVMLMEKKARKIADLLEDVSPNLPTRHLAHFREFATDGGLIRDEFRAEIWPLLATEMPRATHLDDHEEDTDSRDTYSLRSRNFHLTAPNGHLLAESSRTGSESEVFESARSSFGSDEFGVEDGEATTESVGLFDTSH